MAKKSEKAAVDTKQVSGSEGSENKNPPADVQQEEQTGQSGKQHAVTYRITCRNKISKVIGGVSFVNGVGYTNDGFTASWFGNKDGYEVKEAGS